MINKNYSTSEIELPFDSWRDSQFLPAAVLSNSLIDQLSAMLR